MMSETTGPDRPERLLSSAATSRMPWGLMVMDALSILVSLVLAVMLRHAGGHLLGVPACLLYIMLGITVVLLAAGGTAFVGSTVMRDRDTAEESSQELPNDSDLRSPLLTLEEPPPVEDAVDESQTPLSLLEVDMEAAKELAQLDHTLASWRNGIFVVAYLVLTALLFGLGVEAVDIGTTSSVSGIDVVFIALAIASLQVAFFSTKRIVTHLQTIPELQLELGAVHVHSVQFTLDRYDAFCDICSEEIQNGECFQCKLCEFDYCLACFKKGKKLQDWGLLRGDKGVKIPERVRQAGMGTYMFRALGLLRPYALYVLVAASCLMFNVVCRLLVPNIEGGLFDDLIGGHGDAFLRRVRILAAYRVGQTIFQSIQRFVARLISRRLRLDLRMRLVERLLAQDIAFFDATRAGAMSQRVSGDVEDMSRPVPVLINTVLQSAVLIVGAVVCCLISSARLTVLSAACLGPMAYLTRVSAEWSSGLEGQMVACEEEGSAVITEAMTNIRNVRALSAEQYEAKRYERVLSKLLKKMQRDAVAEMMVENLEGLLQFLVEFLVLAFGGLAIVRRHEDALSVGQLIAFTMYWDILREGIEDIQYVFSDLAQAAGAAQRVFDLLDISPDIPLDEGKTVQRDQFRGHIRFEDVHFAYQARPDRPVLNGFCLEVPPGGTCALVGRSGAGKTSLVHLLLRFYDPQGGRITLDGVPLTEVNLTSFHDLVGFVSQDTKLCYGSVRDNLIYGLPLVPDDNEVEAAARAANCTEFIEDMEEGYDTNLGEAGVRLSGGQRQRLAIARAFLRRPRLLILDESTSHLDSENEQLVQQGIDRLVESASMKTTGPTTDYSHHNGRCTVIIVAHRLSTVRNADVIAVVHEGQVAEKGSHEELLHAGGIYAQLVSKQAEGAAELRQKADGNLPSGPDVDKLFDKLLGSRDSSLSRSSSSSSSSSSE